MVCNKFTQQWCAARTRDSSMQPQRATAMCSNGLLQRTPTACNNKVRRHHHIICSDSIQQ
eukprot:5530621-Lingulodinium_polyedra.AAC.1